jgi:hypothetical protein
VNALRQAQGEWMERRSWAYWDALADADTVVKHSFGA